MPRFSQGTMDHDGDGRMGGSKKETEMTNTEKKVADHATSDAKVNHATTEAPKQTAGSKTFVDGVDAPHAKGEPKDAEDAVVFQQGRTARLGGISKDDAPYDQSDSSHKVWLRGWNSVQG